MPQRRVKGEPAPPEIPSQPFAIDRPGPEGTINYATGETGPIR
jgi:hypothetical protein